VNIMEEQLPKKDTAVSRLRTVTAELVRPVPFNPNAGSGGPPNPKKIEEKPNYGRALWNGKFLVIALALIGGVFGFVRVVKQLPTYKGSTTVELSAPNQTFMGRSQLDPEGSENYAVNAANIQTQLRILMGNGLIRKAAERVSLESSPIAPPTTGLFSRLRNRFKLIPQDNMDFLKTAVRRAASSVIARQLGTTHLVEVTCESISAEIASNFINSLAAEYISQKQQFQSGSATRTLQWLGTQIEDAKAKVDEAEAKQQDFIKKQGIAFVHDQNTLADSKLKDLQSVLATSQGDRITKQSRYQLANSSPIDSLPEILDDGSLKSLNQSLITLRKERAQLTATLTSNHVKVKRIDGQIEEVESTLKREKANLVKRIQNDYEAALQREKLMTAAYNGQARAVANQADEAAQYEGYKRNTETTRAIYNRLQQEYSSMSILAAVPSNTVRVIDPAVPLHIPSKPQPVKDMGTMTGFGAALAAGILVLKETIRVKKLSRVFASPGDSFPVLNIPELGTIPAFQLDGSLRRPVPFSLKALRPGNRREHVAVPDLTSWSKQPFLAESIRHAVTSILVRSNHQSHQMLVVTSASPEEGKTTLIGNLGVAMAETGRRVLMIDADLRAPRLHNLFRLDRKQGLSDIYTRDFPVDSIPLNEYIKDTNIPNLFLLSSGEMELQKLGEMLFSRRIRELFSRLRNEYDYVLIDTAPTLQFSDARLLGQVSDGVILIVRSGVSSRDNVQLTARRIAEDGIPIVGTILNHWQPGLGGSALDEYFLGAYDSHYGAAPKAS